MWENNPIPFDNPYVLAIVQIMANFAKENNHINTFFEMKKLLFHTLLPLSMSIMFVSCEKEGNGSNGTKLEGDWWVLDRTELFFNNKKVSTDKSGEVRRILFKDGNATCEFENGTKSVLAYSLIDNEVVIGTTSYRLVSNELVLENDLDMLFHRTDYSYLKEEECFQIFKYDGQTISCPESFLWKFFAESYIIPGNYIYFYGSERKPCLLSGYYVSGKRGYDVNEYLERFGTQEISMVKNNDKEVVLYEYRDGSYYGGPFASMTTVSFDYPYDVSITTYRKE